MRVYFLDILNYCVLHLSTCIQNVLGSWSSKLFAIALLASGQSSTITGTYAGQYVMQVIVIRPYS